jgi:hypothetical protein
MVRSAVRGVLERRRFASRATPSAVSLFSSASVIGTTPDGGAFTLQKPFAL